ncbi:Fe(2+) transporter permease subunit FeoB [Endozoicomonadaceae bacterium StTr2]
MKQRIVAVLGNPNAGKTTLFNGMTGARQQIGNWPGVTVEKKTGHYSHDGENITLVDLPGTYSLQGEVSPDEQIAQQYLLSGEAELVINVLDATNLERNLYLTTQLMSLRIPRLIVLNMMDRARDLGAVIDVDLLSRKLGCPVIPVSARNSRDMTRLQRVIANFLRLNNTMNVAESATKVYSGEETFSQKISCALELIEKGLADEQVGSVAGRQWHAIRLLEGSALGLGVSASLSEKAAALRNRIERDSGEDIDIVMADRRYSFIRKLCVEAVSFRKKASRALTDRIDRIVLNRVLGVPVFFLTMYLMFMVTIHIGSAFIEFFELSVGAFAVDGLASVLTSIDSPGWLTALLAYGIGGGIKTVASFIPVITCLYLCLSLLEGSGYMSRAAFVMDRFMGMMGLPGKAFVPLLIGFGCNVPAIMATRTLERERDRKLAIIMNPFMSCGARLPVYALFAAAFFPASGQNLIFTLYLAGFAIAILTGLIMRWTLLKGSNAPCVMELPVYQLPALKTVLIQTWDRLYGFLTGAGKVIVLVVAVLGMLGHVDSRGRFSAECYSEHSILSEAGRAIAPLFYPMGVSEDNWPAAVGLFTGIFAKEAVIGTLDSLYSQLAGQQKPAPDDDVGLLDKLKAAALTIPANLNARLGGGLMGGLDLELSEIGDSTQTAEALDLNDGMINQMQQRFATDAAAIAYLLFVLLYVPCVAAMGAVKREAGVRWMLLVGGWSTFVAYSVATGFFQFATFASHPLYSFCWLSGLFTVFAAVIFALWLTGQRQLPATIQVNRAEVADAG